MKHFPLLLFAASVLLTSCGGSNGESQSPFPSFDAIPVIVKSGDYVSMVNADGKIVVDNEYPTSVSITPVSDGLYWILEGDAMQLYSLSDPKTPVKTPDDISTIHQALPYVRGISVIQSDNNPLQIVDRRLGVIATMEPWASSVCHTGDDMLLVTIPQQDKTYANALVSARSGQTIIDNKELSILGCNERIAVAYKNDSGKLALIDIDNPGKIIELDGFDTGEYSIMATEFHGGLLACCDSEGKLVYFNKKGEKALTVPNSNVSDISLGDTDFSFYSGYAVFIDNSDKFGVINSKGEVAIRPKYRRLANMGHGRFMANRGDNWGLIDADDNPLSKFNYVAWQRYTVGDNYIVKDDEDNWLILGTDGKQIGDLTFDGVKNDEFRDVNYVNLNPTLDMIKKRISNIEHSLTVAEYMKSDTTIHIENVKPYDTYVTINGDAWPVYTFLEKMVFSDKALISEKTHTETVDDGWFAREVTVSDGYEWSDAPMNYCSFNFNLSGGYISAEYLAQTISQALVKDGFSKEDRHGLSLFKTLDDDSQVHCGITIDRYLVKVIIERIEELGC